MFESIIEDVPNYDKFYTVDELRKSSQQLAEKNPSKVKILKVGASRNGEVIEALKIGSGKKAALLFAFPHPNEPIGSMMLEYLSQKLVEEITLSELDFTWYLVKYADPDGARLNEGWFKGPFTPLNFALNYYRPPRAPRQQPKKKHR